MTDQEKSIRSRLAEIGLMEDGDIPLAEAALLLAALDRPESDLAVLQAQLDELKIASRALQPVAGAVGRAQALADLLFVKNGFKGDNETYDDPRNASLIDVLERRRGLPVTIALLYLYVARCAGWGAVGLDFPGHFVIRVDGEDESDIAVLDPFNGGQVLAAKDLERLLANVTGADAKLDPHHAQPVSDRAVLLRVLNNIRTRALGGDDLERSMEIMERMVLVAPNDPTLRFETGVIAAQAGHIRTALESFESCLTLGPNQEMREDTEGVLEGLRAQLH